MKENKKPLYAKIAIARKQLPGMDEDAYRGLLEREFGTRSAKDLSYGQLVRLVDMLGRMGATYTAGGKAAKPSGRRGARSRPHARGDFYEIADDSHGRIKRYIAAMWRNDLGYDMTGLDTLVKRLYKVECFAWLRDWTLLRRLANFVEERVREKAAKEKNGAFAL